MQCVETFYHDDDDKQHGAVNVDLEIFQKRQGNFSKKMAKTCERFDFNPGKLMHQFCPDLSLQLILSKIFCNQFCTCLRHFTSFCSILVEALWRWSTKFAIYGH